MDQQLQQRQQSRVERSLKELEAPVMSMDTSFGQFEHWEHFDNAEKEKPAYGAPAPETHKGKTYVSKLKDEDRKGTKSDVQRLHIKTRLAGLADQYRALAGDDADFLAILDKIDAYTQIDMTAVTGGLMTATSVIETENHAYDAVVESLKAYVAKMVTKIEEDTATGHEKQLLQRTYELFGYFQEQKNGYLERPPQGATTIDATKRTIKTGLLSFDCDAKNMPLFPHEPSVNDIAQRLNGDCYLLAGLASIVTMNPEKIKECMRDNQDGTVTVRFYQKQGEDNYTPVYVTVQKKIPRVLGIADTFASNCLWVQMIERAYTASGMHIDYHDLQNNDVNGMPVPDDIDGMYELLKKDWNKKDEVTRKAHHKMFPHIVDEKGNLHKWQPHYEQIEGGFSGEFIERLLGAEHKRELVKPGDLYKVHSEQRSYDTILREIYRERAKDAGFESTNGNDLLYSAITGVQLPAHFNERTAEQKNDWNAVVQIFYALRNYLEDNADKSIYSDFQAEMLSNIDAFAERFRNDEAKAALAASPRFQEIIDYFKLEAMRKNGVYTMYKSLSGQYNDTQNEIFQKVRDALAAGKFVGGGTQKFKSGRGLNGESKEDGLVGTHAYTVLDTEIRQISGKDYKFIKLRNPWGMSVRQYYTKEGKDGLQAEKESFSNQGVFLIELSDFISKFKELEIN